MSSVTKSINSKIFGKKMKLSVYRPNGYENVALSVLYFLHGRTGNEQLIQQLGMDKIADELFETERIKPFMIVCPNIDNSRGINSAETYQEVKGKYGIIQKGRYEDYLIDEIIPFIDRNFNTIKSRDGRYIGGISSGGYTALHIAFRHQDLFSKVGGHMPAIDLTFADEDECYFANEAMWLKYSPISIAENASIGDLKVFLDDGKNDEGRFYYACERLYQILKDKGVDVQNYLFNGHHNAEYVVSNMNTYLRFYGE